MDKMTSSGSATGNPRNKTALKPGHSLMDWIRLGASGTVDLTGVGGIPRDVTPQQLAQHATRDDAWLALRGRVYNVTHYLDFHPGGAEELMKGAGKDATDLFNKVHAWVNYESLLKKCVVGRLRRDSQGASEELRAALRAATARRNSMEALAAPLASPSPPTSPPAPVTPTSPFSAPGACPAVPRMDWFQQCSSVTLVWYASSARPAWPGARIRLREGGKELNVSLLLPPPAPPPVPAAATALGPRFSCAIVSPPSEENIVAAERRRAHRHTFRRVLPAPVMWPPAAVETCRGKLQVTFRKESPGAWASLEAVASPAAVSTADTAAKVSTVVAAAETKALEAGQDEVALQFERMRVVTSQQLTKDVRLVVLRGDRSLDVASVGQHVVARAEVHGMEVRRRYTPVPPYLHRDFKPPEWEPDCLCLIVKGYPNGALSHHITSLKEGDIIDISEMDGDFDSRCLVTAKQLCLLAAGSGITPMLSIIAWSHCLRNRAQILLVCFNRTQADRIWADQLSCMAEQSAGRLKVEHVLSQAGSEWNGRRGRVELPLLQELLPPPGSESFISACGPPGFTADSERFLKELGYAADEYHIFEG